MKRNMILGPPDFAIVGAAKCGTTALYTYLSGHPGIAMSPRKEPRYWSSDLDHRRYRIDSYAEYCRLWSKVPDGVLRGEATPSYILSDEAIPKLLAARPDVRLIAMVRNPVEMAAAWHSEMLAEDQEDVASFERAWRLQSVRREARRIPPRCLEPRLLQYRQVCRIGDYLERFIEYVPEGQRHIILFDDLQSNPAAVYRHALQFLGVADDRREDFSPIRANRILRSPRLRRAIGAVPEWLGSLYGPIRSAARYMGLRPLAALNAWNLYYGRRRQLRPRFQLELAREFGPQIDKLERLLDRDLSHWRPRISDSC